MALSGHSRHGYCPHLGVKQASAAIDLWSAGFNTNDPEIIAKNYCSDAIFLGTVSPIVSEGTQAIIKYFTPTKGTGNKNAIEFDVFITRQLPDDF